MPQTLQKTQELPHVLCQAGSQFPDRPGRKPSMAPKGLHVRKLVLLSPSGNRLRGNMEDLGYLGRPHEGAVFDPPTVCPSFGTLWTHLCLQAGLLSRVLFIANRGNQENGSFGLNHPYWTN